MGTQERRKMKVDRGQFRVSANARRPEKTESVAW